MAKFDKVPLEWLYYIIDGYASNSVLHANGVVVKPGLVPADLPELSLGVTIPAPMPLIFINLKRCLTDEGVIVTLGQEMAHALEKIQHGNARDTHRSGWKRRNYTQRLSTYRALHYPR
jgi:hypothetical protein